MLTLLVLLVGLALGVAVGLVGTGSMLAVPILIYGVGIDVHGAVCVAMLTMTAIGVIGTIQASRSGAVNLRSATIMSVCGALIAPLGAWLNRRLPPLHLLLLFAVVVLATSVVMLLRQIANRQGIDLNRSRELSQFSVGVAGVIIGLLGGLLGISGGFIAVPALVAYQRLEMHRAVATSWAIIAVTSAAATLGHFLGGQRLRFADTTLFLAGATGGFEIAVRTAPKISEPVLKRTFAIVMSIISAAMVVRLLMR